MQETIAIVPCMEIIQQERSAPILLCAMWDETNQQVDTAQLRRSAIDKYAKLLHDLSYAQTSMPGDKAAAHIAAEISRETGIPVMGLAVDTLFALDFAKRPLEMTQHSVLKLSVSQSNFISSGEIEKLIKP